MRVLLFIAGVVVTLIAVLYVAISVSTALSDPREPVAAKATGSRLLSISGATVLAVVAHPDDIDWYAGGTLAALANAGNRVVVVVATSGEKGGKGGDGLAALRETEQLRAASILGYDDVIFLGLPDRALAPDRDFVGRIVEVLLRERPRYVFTFDPDRVGYVYRHPDHLAAGVVTVKALRSTRLREEVLFFHTNSPDVMVDIASTLELKGAALAEHQSQRARGRSRILRALPWSSRFSQGFLRSFPKQSVDAAELFRREISQPFPDRAGGTDP